MNKLTAAELAAFLGITSSGVRQVIRRKQIAHVGMRGRAKLYDPDEVFRHTGVQDRRKPD